MMNFGAYLKQTRKASGIKQEDLVTLLGAYGFEYTASAVSTWENGRAIPPVHNPRFVAALAEILRVSQAELQDAIELDQVIPKSELAKMLAQMTDKELDDLELYARFLLEKRSQARQK